MLQNFWAITKNWSLYQLSAEGYAVRIRRCKGPESWCEHVHIGRRLLFHTIIKKRVYEERTSPVVALFRDEESARKCLMLFPGAMYDRRWKQQTIEVLQAIEKSQLCFTADKIESLYPNRTAPLLWVIAASIVVVWMVVHIYRNYF